MSSSSELKLHEITAKVTNFDEKSVDLYKDTEGLKTQQVIFFRGLAGISKKGIYIMKKLLRNWEKILIRVP